jgi:glycosyltransferase involved in cell wall biosynthesis
VIKTPIKNVRKDGSASFRIVTCSSLIKLKRIDLIITALGNLRTDRKIVWNHFGEGHLQKEMKDLAQGMLGHLKNIEYQFMGQIQNSELLKFYSENKIDLFINTSSSEGIPVSIMEAQSFGIPVIATDVGGVREIVVEGTGSVLSADFKTEQLTEIIQFYIGMPDEEANKMRKNAYNNWGRSFNASENYKNFILKVNSILAAANKTDTTA